MIFRTLQCRPFSTFQFRRNLFTTSQFLNNAKNPLQQQHSSSLELDSKMVNQLTSILRENPQNSWHNAIAKSSSNLILNLQPHHVEKVLLKTLANPRLALRFLKFLGLHYNFSHSIPSFFILVHDLVHFNLFWPASSLVQTLIHHYNDCPRRVFGESVLVFKGYGFSSLLGFDLLIQNYVQCKRTMDGVVVLELMMEEGIIPEVRTVSALFHGLIAISFSS